MAEEIKSVSPKKPSDDSASAPAVPPAPAAPDLSKLIVEQGKPQENFLSAPTSAPASLEGKYRVVHGTINFGYNISPAGEPTATIAHPGAIVQLSAVEAQRMLAEKSVERV